MSQGSESKEDTQRKKDEEMIQQQSSVKEQVTQKKQPLMSAKSSGSVWGTFKAKALNFTQFLDDIENNYKNGYRRDSQSQLKQRQLDIREFNQIMMKHQFLIGYDYISNHKEHVDYIMTPQTLDDIFKMISNSSQVFYALHFLRLIPEDQ